MRTMAKAQGYIPPLSYDWLTPLYDRIIPVIMPEMALKRRLIEQARIESGNRVLDLGAGTATLTVMIKQAYPDSEVVGVDGDSHVLEIGRAKAAAAATQLTLDHGFAARLPYSAATFDRVFASLMLHHLSADDKRVAFAEVWRVLRTGGELHILDFGKPHTVPAYLISLIMRHAEQTVDNIRGRLPDMMREAGFVQVEETAHGMTLLGTLSLYKGRKEV